MSTIRSLATIFMILTLLPLVQPIFNQDAILSSAEDMAPITPPAVGRPTGDGQYEVGYTYDNITTSTKNYTMTLKTFYPAQDPGHNTTADKSGGPYPTILWLPGACCGPEHYTEILMGMASWGIVVMTVGVNWDDYPNSGNDSDTEEILDFLENLNATGTSLLYQMVDKEAFGLTGHSAGAGLAVVDAPFVDRIKAVQPLGAALSNSTVDALVPYWNKPILCQVGLGDNYYINGCRRIFEKLPAPNSEIELIGGDHFGPFKDYLLVGFFLYYLDGKTDYWPYLYGEEAVKDVIAGDYDLQFKTSSTHYFPPKVHAYVLKSTTPMDQPVTFGGDIEGYFLPNHPQSMIGWDFDGDGTDDYQNSTNANLTYTYTEPADLEPVLTYRLGRFFARSLEPLSIAVTNPQPIVRAGEDQTVNEDQTVMFDANGSFDTPSDNGTLEFNWTFGDGAPTGYGSEMKASHIFKRAGVYNVVLMVRDRHGAVSTDIQMVTVQNVAPTAEAGADMTALEDSVILFHGIANDTISDWPGLRFRWDFGDGTDMTDWANVTDAEHVYTAMGNYTAVFYVRDQDGENATDGLKVIVTNGLPTAEIVLSDGITQFDEDHLITFSGIGEDTPTDQKGLVYRWDFGDDNLTDWSMDPGAKHSYAKAGFYHVELMVKDDNGALAVKDIMIEISNLAPTARILEPGFELHVMEDDEVSFKGEGNDTPSDRAGLNTSWEIEGRTYFGNTAKHAFTKMGTYGALFKVTDPDGISTIKIMTVIVFNLPPTITAVVEPLTVLTGQTVNFSLIIDDTPTDLSNIQVLWEYDDGTQGTVGNGTHIFSVNGTYIMRVTVKDDDGEKDTRTFTITVMMPYTPPPPPKEEKGLNPAPLEALLVVLTVAGVALLAFTMNMGEPGPSPPSRPVGKGKPMHKTKKGSKTNKKSSRK